MDLLRKLKITRKEFSGFITVYNLIFFKPAIDNGENNDNKNNQWEWTMRLYIDNEY